MYDINNNNAPLDISDKYHFEYSNRWVMNNSLKKRVTIRKLKAYLMNFVFVATCADIDLGNGNAQITFNLA